MAHSTDSLSRYLPTDQQAKAWGWRLIGAGRQIVAAHDPYPVQGHPMDYLFAEDGRRTLDEFQIVFISEGTGTFESASFQRRTVHTGEALILFPGEWHRYRPDPETGWTEYWLGFRGREAERIMAAFFSLESPLCPVGQSDALLRHLDQLLTWLNESVPAKEQILASHIPLVLAFLTSGASIKDSPTSHDSDLVIRAKAAMLTNLQAKTDLKQLAKDLGVSYSRFRFAFKRQTGFAPRAFENIIKLNRAKDLLHRENLSVSETADALGFTSLYYFSRAFAKQFGQSPQKWLREQKRKH